MNITANDLVRPVGDDLRHAFFRVLGVTRNGWARCTFVALADGQRPAPVDAGDPWGGYVFTPRFRVTELKRVDALPPIRILAGPSAGGTSGATLS